MHKFLLILALLPATALAQATPLLKTADTFFAISVADLEASTKWYRDQLGLTVTRDFPRNDQTRAAARILEGGGLTVELVRRDDDIALDSLLPSNRPSAGVHGIFKVGMVVEDFDATLAAIRRRGIPIAIGPFPKRADQPANMIIRDNAGNYIQIIGRR